MQPILALWTPGTLVVAVVCVVATFFARRIIETAFPSLQAVYRAGTTSYINGWARWWNQVVLYSLPVVSGALLGLFKSTWLWPDVGIGVRILLGITVGWLSTFIYKVLRRAIKSNLKMDLPDVVMPNDSVPPPAEVTVDPVDAPVAVDPTAEPATDPAAPTTEESSEVPPGVPAP